MPPAVWPEFAPPFTFRTTDTADLVPRSSFATSGISLPLPSSPKEMPTSAMSWLVNGVRDMVAGKTRNRVEAPLLPDSENATYPARANKNLFMTRTERSFLTVQSFP